MLILKPVILSIIAKTCIPIGHLLGKRCYKLSVSGTNVPDITSRGFSGVMHAAVSHRYPSLEQTAGFIIPTNAALQTLGCYYKQREGTPPSPPFTGRPE